MNILIDPRNPDCNKGNSIHGYRICRVCSLEQISAIFYELEHEKTKTRHVHISTNDTENTFSVAFKTVPEDSTGVAHIFRTHGSVRFQIFSSAGPLLFNVKKKFIDVYECVYRVRLDYVPICNPEQKRFL